MTSLGPPISRPRIPRTAHWHRIANEVARAVPTIPRFCTDLFISASIEVLLTHPHDSDQRELRQRDNKFSATDQVIPLAFPEFVEKVPRQHKKVVRPGVSRLVFRNDRDASADRYFSPFIGV